MLLIVIKLLFLTGDSEHVPEIESTSHESELEDDENELLFSVVKKNLRKMLQAVLQDYQMKRLTFKFNSFHYRTIVFFDMFYVSMFWLEEENQKENNFEWRSFHGFLIFFKFLRKFFPQHFFIFVISILKRSSSQFFFDFNPSIFVGITMLILNLK